MSIKLLPHNPNEGARYTPEAAPEPSKFEIFAACEFLLRAGRFVDENAVDLAAHCIALGRHIAEGDMAPTADFGAPDDIHGELIALGQSYNTLLAPGQTPEGLRAYVRCTEEQIKAVRYAPMYRPVVVIESELLGHIREAAARAADHATIINTLQKTCAEYEERLKELQSVRMELQAYRNGGVTEEILRRNDGFIKVGEGCAIVRAEEFVQMRAKMHAVETLMLSTPDSGEPAKT